MPVNPTYPGVYIEEIPSGVQTITGVATSIAVFLGRTLKGQRDKAVRCFSYSDFSRSFGGGHAESDMGKSVKLFFDNGGTDCYIVRLAHGGEKAKIVLTDESKNNALEATAKSSGTWGNGIRLQIDYDTVNPDETFNLTVIYQESGVEISREKHVNLSMDPDSSRFAPDYITQSSELIDMKLHADIASGGSHDMTLIANSFAGFSQGRFFKSTPIGAFRTEFETILGQYYKYEMDVDGNGYIPISLATVFGAAAPAIVAGSAWSLTDMSGRIEDVINEQLNASISGLNVLCEFITSGSVTALRVTADSGNKKSVHIRRASSKDLSGPLMFGLDQGGIEPVRYSDFRPVPTALIFNSVDNIIKLAALTRDQITSINIDAEGAITFDLSSLSTNATDQWFVDQNDKADGIREKLRAIAKAVNSDTGSSWKAVLWSYHLAFLAKSGSVNKTAAQVASLANATLGGTNFILNVKQYVLGSTGTGSYQDTPAVTDAGTEGTAPEVDDFQGSEDNHTGFYALDLADIFNLMVIPGDTGIDDATFLSLWDAASIYCEDHRAFLLIDPPTDWVKSGLPLVVQDNSLITSLRASVVKTNSAVFYPRLKYKSTSGLVKTIGPSGAIAGLMARTDATRGVWKAPAGTDADLRGILGLELKLTDMENGVLNKQAVNCLREFPSGYICWGSRTMDGFDDNSKADWKYIPVRRFTLFLEESLFRGTKWVVFEPNDEPLWAKIRLNVNAFMMRLFRQGAFQGSTPDKAYYVKCDSETTPQADINLGIVNIEVGFAPLKPAEFVIIKIQQMTGKL